MLWAFDPVKYCSAAPRLSGGDESQVGLIAVTKRTLDFVSPPPEHALDQGIRR